MVAQLYAKYEKKNLRDNFEKNAARMDKWANWPIFGQVRIFPKISAVCFKYLWSLTFEQNIKKKLICQSWEKCCDKKWMYIWTDRPKFIGLSQSMGPKMHTVWYLEKEGRPKIKTWSIDRALNSEHFYGKSMQKRCTKN